jgi:hypothetical protein
MDVGLKLTVTPAGKALALNFTAELKAPTTAVVIADVPVLFGGTVTDAGEEESVK